MLPQAKNQIEVNSLKSGFVNSFDTESVGISAMLLGAGRMTKEDIIDYAAGITLKKKIGDKVQVGDTLCMLHTNKDEYNEAYNRMISAFNIGDDKPHMEEYIFDIIK